MGEIKKLLNRLRNGKTNRRDVEHKLNELWLGNQISNTQYDVAMIQVDVIVNMQDCEAVA